MDNPLDRLARRNGDQSALGYGDVTMAGDGSQRLPAGASAPAMPMQGGSVMLSNDAMQAALKDLSDDFAKFLESQKTFMDTFSASVKDIKDLLGQVTKMAERSLSGHSASGVGYAIGGAGNALAGYTSTATIRSAFGSALTTIGTSLHQHSALTVPTTPSIGGGGAFPPHPPLPVPGGAGAGGGGGTPTPVGSPSNPAPKAGMLGSLSGRLGSVGSTFGAISGLYQDYLHQRGANYQLQNVLGGSNSSQFDVRAARKGFRLSHFGESSTVDDELYNSALQMGYRDAHAGIPGLFGGLLGPLAGQDVGSGLRGQYSATQVANTGYNLRHKYGVSSQEYYNAVETMSENTGASLTQVAQGLTDVTKAAHQFGVNAVLVRQKLNDTFSSFTQNGLGAGAMPLAEAAVSSITAGGKMMQNIGFQLGDNMQYRVAASAGMNQSQFQVLASRNPVAAARLTDQVASQSLEAILGPDAVAWLRGEIGKYPDAATSETVKKVIAQNFEAQFANRLPSAQALVASVSNLLPYTGINESNVWYFIVSYYAGNTVSSTAARQQKQGAPVGGTYHAQGQGGVVGGTKQVASDVASFFGADSNWGHASAAQKQYQRLSQSGQSDTGWLKGQHSPVLNALFKAIGDSDEKVAVMTRSGQKVLSLQDAIKYYPAEIAQGQALFVGGKYDGQSVQQVTGMTDQSRTTMAEVQKEELSQTADRATHKAKTYKAPSSSSGGSGAQKVTVDLSPAARQLLQIMPNTAAPASGMPQTPSLNPGSS